MGKVIGPISIEDWYLMKNLLTSIREMQEERHDKFALAIKKERSVVDEIKSQYLQAA